jgi:hypothetical protein
MWVSRGAGERDKERAARETTPLLSMGRVRHGERDEC